MSRWLQVLTLAITWGTAGAKKDQSSLRVAMAPHTNTRLLDFAVIYDCSFKLVEILKIKN